MALDDSVADCQTQTSSLHAFGGIERFENTLANFFFHSRTGVGESESQPAQFALTANRQLAALGHCVHGIDDQVHEHLAQFGGITQSQHSVFGIECNLDIQAARARFILPTRARDFDCIAQQSAHVEQFKFGGQ